MKPRYSPWLALALLCGGLVWIGPYLWMLSTSFKTLDEIVRAPAYPLPSAFRFDAYREAMTAMPIWRYTLNTVVMATAIALIQITLALPAGYALGKLRFRGRGAAFGLVLVCLVVPAQVTFVPVFTMLGPLGLVNTMTALVAPFAVSAFGTFLVRQAMLAVPDELIEAARLDGASELVIVYRLLRPLVAPTLS
ncbi:MAG: carbohydrate ABC transporter permease, partial [Myxococcales bacterium]|nr:carbohydrate ABC transporter permease [Myxococcales bacterium]